MASNIRRFDLYDFFSVLLPGTALLLGLVPFLPTETDLGSLGVVLPLITIGFVVGRAVHSIAVSIEKYHEESPHTSNSMRWSLFHRCAETLFIRNEAKDVSHRRRFIREIQGEGDINDKMVKLYLRMCRDAFSGLEIPEDNSDLDPSIAESIYELTRAHIHVDARGRSRTFQAVYAFYRSMWIISIFLAIVYAIYGLVVAFGLDQDIVNYTSIIGVVGVSGSIVTLTSVALLTVAYYSFSAAKWNYQKYYVRYLLADFIVIQNNVWNTLESVNTLLGK